MSRRQANKLRLNGRKWLAAIAASALLWWIIFMSAVQDCSTGYCVFGTFLAFSDGRSHELPDFPPLGSHFKSAQRNIFQTLIFTRWRVPRAHQHAARTGETIELLSYDAVENENLQVNRPLAVQLSLGRLSEIDFRHEFPPVFHRFDVFLYWDSMETQGWENYSTWSSGKVNSAFIEVPEDGLNSAFHRLSDAVKGMRAAKKNNNKHRFLVLGASDTHLSNVFARNFVSQIVETGYFDQIYYEAYDVEIPTVWPMPIGLTEAYLLGLRSGTLESALQNIDLSSKYGVLAAWGSWWPMLDATLPWRQKLQGWVNRTEWISRASIPRAHWYTALASHRFMLCPDGNGVVSPKWTEALLMQTIPITPPLLYYKKLKKMGYPFVVVDSWEDVTPERLDMWWEELSPVLEAAAWMHTGQCWWALMSSGLNSPRVDEALLKCASDFE